MIKLYKFLARRTESEFNKIIHKRLNHSRSSRYPISLSRIAKALSKGDNEGKIVVTVSTVVNDERMIVCPKMTICALKFTESARKRILKAGGEVLTFD